MVLLGSVTILVILAVNVLFCFILSHSSLQSITAHWGPKPANNCWPHVYLSIDNHPANLGMTCSQHVSPPAVGVLDQNYCYKLEATQIPPDAGLAPTPCILRKFIPHLGSTCIASHGTNSIKRLGHPQSYQWGKWMSIF